MMPQYISEKYSPQPHCYKNLRTHSPAFISSQDSLALRYFRISTHFMTG